MCQAGKPEQLPQWFPGGPTIDFILLPVRDPSRPWGTSNCTDCKTGCCGHFLKPDKCLSNVKEASESVVIAAPPSQIIKEFLQAIARPPLESEIATLSQSVLLPEQEVKFWIEHLETVSRNRKRGAVKAAATRQAKQVEKYFCGVCSRQYTEETEEVDTGYSAISATCGTILTALVLQRNLNYLSVGN